MSKRQKIYYLKSQIMIDAEKINLLLQILHSEKIDSLKESYILAGIALDKCIQISKNNEKIGKILKF